MFINDSIYKLKFNYSTVVDIYDATYTVDRQTGNKTISLKKITIDKAVVLPVRYFRNDVESFFDTGDREIIIDKSDLPIGWTINLNQYLIIKNKRYEIKNIFDFCENTAYSLIVKETVGQKIVQIKNVISVMVLEQNAQSQLV